jgi:phosphatidate phosphatase APP1
MPRGDEQIVLFPALARPLSGGRWLASLRAVIFRSPAPSIRRGVLVRAIARAAEVSDRPLLLERLRRNLAPFLVESCARRKITVELADTSVSLGPSGRNGHVRGDVEFTTRVGAAGPLEWQVVGGDGSRASVGVVHLLPERGLSVVCDIDDTIKHSCVPDTRELLRNTFLRPSRCIAPVRGALLRLAAAGAAVHYVSASPWQLFPTLRDFVRRAGLPDGSFHLKEFRAKDRSVLALLAPPEQFKTPLIEGLMDAWPLRRFVLVGDSAERDPEIYGGIAVRRRAQVVGIVIRAAQGVWPSVERFQGAPNSVVRVLDDAAEWESTMQAFVM